MVCRPDHNRPAIKEAIKALQKRKKEYEIRFENIKEQYYQKKEQGLKRAREELPSENESSSNPSGQRSSQSKKNRKKRRKSIEEEIVAPKLSNHGNLLLILNTILTNVYSGVH